MGKLYLFSAKGAKRYYLTGSGWLAPRCPLPIHYCASNESCILSGWALVRKSGLLFARAIYRP